MYLVGVIFISITSESSFLSSSIDLTFIAGLRRQAVILITIATKLTRETRACYTVTVNKQRTGQFGKLEGRHFG